MGVHHSSPPRRSRTQPRHEAAGPLAQILPIPQDAGGDDDPLAGLRADIGAARGKAVLVETTAAGWGEGRGSGPQSDWKPNRLGPMMPEAIVRVADSAFARIVAACGASVSLFSDADGTAQREALRRWNMGTVRPLARLLEYELTARLDTTVKLRFDGDPLDMQARAATFKALVAGGVAVNEALTTAGLLTDDWRVALMLRWPAWRRPVAVVPRRDRRKAEQHVRRFRPMRVPPTLELRRPRHDPPQPAHAPQEAAAPTAVAGRGFPGPRVASRRLDTIRSHK